MSQSLDTARQKLRGTVVGEVDNAGSCSGELLIATPEQVKAEMMHVSAALPMSCTVRRIACQTKKSDAGGDVGFLCYTISVRVIGYRLGRKYYWLEDRGARPANEGFGRGKEQNTQTVFHD